MGKFNYLLGKEEEFTLPSEDGTPIVFKMKALNGDSIELFLTADKDSQTELIFNMITATLQQTDKSITVDDVKELPLQYLQGLTTLVMDLNELKQ